MSRRSLEDKREHAVSPAPLGGAVCNIKGPLTAERRGAATGNERFKAEDESLISSVLRWREKIQKKRGSSEVPDAIITAVSNSYGNLGDFCLSLLGFTQELQNTPGWDQFKPVRPKISSLFFQDFFLIQIIFIF